MPQGGARVLCRITNPAARVPKNRVRGCATHPTEDSAAPAAP
ncbi:hypothetical protein HMPREF9123_2445 [Neisseria bacilliformis ATCC BAA-1200]|uniref:Uncharacterized protein n=1 Tax=Neisseria bacilliformis ATCC BAA-1200 TaxID=888742 RepID=F2BFD8_9NEIS|nr:hypothetical protein HMPREF9123_2445 [Neisseria bacilliformis ATCC BAA-1200]